MLAAMSDSRKSPPLSPLLKAAHARAQSQNDRDVEGFAARRERDAASVTEFLQDDVTGKYEGEELKAQREVRPVTDRIQRLEKKHDDLRADLKDVRADFKSDLSDVRSDVKTLSGHVGDLRSDVSGAVGKLDGQQGLLTELLSIVKNTAEHASDRDHITFTAKVDVDKAQELAKVDVGKAAELAKVEVAKEQELDTVEGRKVRRKAIAKLVGGLFVGAYALYEFLHRLGAL
jgi:septal ring factor EnvC (AmiA/AmiB activator)